MGPLSFKTTDVTSDIDPRIQKMLFFQKQGKGTPTFKCTAPGFIPIIAKVSDLIAWKNLSEVKHGAEIKIPSEENNYIVTARVPLSRVEALRNHSFVTSLKVAQIVRHTLAATLKDTGLTATSPQPLATDLKQAGAGVVVGVVDYGGDFRHSHFIDKTGKTRLISLWDQSGDSSPDSPFGYGTEHSAEEINRAINTTNPYQTLQYNPGIGAHGTHVMDIAAGSGTATNSKGVASKAKIIFVALNSEEENSVDDIVNTTFGDSVRVVEAVKYIFDKAGKQPCVVNLSLGTNGGPHDGTNPVEQAFNALVEQQNNRAIVVAAANAYADKIHINGQVATDKPVDIKWTIPPEDPTGNEIEIWYSGGDKFRLEILDSSSRSITSVELGKNGQLYSNDNGVKHLFAFISHRAKDPNNGDNVIHIFQDPTYRNAGGTWTLRLHAVDIKADGKFHAWVERDDYSQNSQSNFVVDEPKYTLGSISTGSKTITVASYDAHKNNSPISWFSGSGPTRKEQYKPEVSAPGHDVWAAKSGSINKLTQMSGTSMASPAVTGLVARIFGIAHARGISLTIDQTRQILIDTCRKQEGQQTPWDPRYGYGRISAAALEHPLLKSTA